MRRVIISIIVAISLISLPLIEGNDVVGQEDHAISKDGSGALRKSGLTKRQQKIDESVELAIPHVDENINSDRKLTGLWDVIMFGELLLYVDLE